MEWILNILGFVISGVWIIGREIIISLAVVYHFSLLFSALDVSLNLFFFLESLNFTRLRGYLNKLTSLALQWRPRGAYIYIGISIVSHICAWTCGSCSGIYWVIFREWVWSVFCGLSKGIYFTVNNLRHSE